MERKRLLCLLLTLLMVFTSTAFASAQNPVSIESQPETVSEFVPVFAEQMARYNQVAPLCWPGNSVVGKSVVLEDVDTNRFWFIAPDGAVTELSEEDVKQMGVSHRERPDDFSFFEGGMYITVSDQSVKDKNGWDTPHVGAYDSILWLTHEGFHKWEQNDKWNNPDLESIANSGRDEFFLDISARAKRNLLQTQLMWAAAEPGNTKLILNALATYENYKIENANDYANTLYFDRIEGTAQYFELVSSLYIFYPDQISGKKDLEQAFTSLAQYQDSYIRLGVVSESYNIGMFACVLLDRLDENWKERIMREPFVTPLEILSSHYKDKKLPEPKQLTQEEIESVTEDIREKVRFLIERQIPVLTGLKQGLDDMPEEKRIAYEMFLDEMIRKFKEMITILPEEEQKTYEDFIRAIEEKGFGDVQKTAANRADSFKVIGYYCGEWFDAPVEKLQAEKLTHIMYGFLIPTEDGGCKPFQEPEELTQLIEKCHRVGTQVYVSLGGYSEKNGPPLVSTFEKIAASDEIREIFINNVIDVVNQYGFDGVEMDWEYPRYSTSGDYEKMIAELAGKLRPLGKGLSTALPGTGSTNGQNVWEGLAAVTDKTLENFDFISLMCYDLHSDPNHSPIWFSNTTINYWKNFRNVPAEKLILGMPLYARPSWQQYRFLVDMDKENAYRDYADTEPESTYNGLNTLREKTMIALRSAGGVMLFDVNEDTYDETSVVSMIHDTIAAMDGLSDKEINNYIWVVINNQAIPFTIKDGMGIPFIDENNRTLIPMRKLLESIGAEISYVSDEKGRVISVSADLDETHITIHIGSDKYLVNGKTLTMDTIAVIKDGRTYLPVRPVLEAFGYEVSYSKAGKSVYAASRI